MERRTKLLLIGFIILVCLVLIIVLCVHFIRKSPSPSLSFEPMPSKGGLIQYTSSDLNDITQWTHKLEDFLNRTQIINIAPKTGLYINDFYTAYYASAPKSQKTVWKDCQQGVPPKQNEVCSVDISRWKPCVRESRFNFHSGGPCIFLFIDQDPEWIPEYYNSTSTLPTTMPTHLKYYITNITILENSKPLNVVWVSCEGETAADLEFIGPLQYFPSLGFGGQYFPVMDKEGYLKPLVAIHFMRPRIGVVINVVCKAWARNIDHEKEQGIVHIELLIE